VQRAAFGEERVAGLDPVRKFEYAASQPCHFGFDKDFIVVSGRRVISANCFRDGKIIYVGDRHAVRIVEMHGEPVTGELLKQIAARGFDVLWSRGADRVADRNLVHAEFRA
jgi:hypothetical protein